MKYYKLIANAYSCKNPLILKINSEENHFDEKNIYKDIDLRCNLIKAYSYSEKNDTIIEDFIVSNIGLPIVTERAKEVIENLSIGNTEFIPIKVTNMNNISTKLYALHIRNHISDDAINLDICKCIGNSIAVYGFFEEKINGNDLFRLQKNNLSIFVSQKFVQAAKKNKLTGFLFTDVRTVWINVYLLKIHFTVLIVHDITN